MSVRVAMKSVICSSSVRRRRRVAAAERGVRLAVRFGGHARAPRRARTRLT